MTKCSLLFLTFLLIFGSFTAKSQQFPVAGAVLDSLYEEEDFFRLNTCFHERSNELTPEYKLLYQARIQTVFNRQEEANQVILQLLDGYKNSLPDSVICEVYGLRLMNHINLYEYADAAACSRLMLKEYAEWLDTGELENLQNELLIWDALSDVPKQRVEKSCDSRIQLRRDKAGLLNIEVTSLGKKNDFIFDTGANFSVITRSAADQMNLTVRDIDFYVTSATGNRVRSDLAVADELYLGDLVCKHVVFLVFDDADLSFPQADYYINGIIGFPVIEAMEEIRIDQKDLLIIPEKAVDYQLQNFALNGLMPVISVNHGDDVLRFHFDTGATSTSLFKPFYEKYRQEIETTFPRKQFTSGSAGGMKVFDGYLIPEIELRVAQQSATLDSLQLHMTDLSETPIRFHGNLGQDFIRQFGQMIISFTYSSILFEPE